MDVQKKLDDIVETIGSARSLPMSASCVVNRAELLSLLEEVRQALPGSLARARELIGDRDHLVAQARWEAEKIIESAHAERDSLISDTRVARQSRDEAERILAEARGEAEEIRAEADDYVDSKLANFEVVLAKTIGSVDRGREKLLGRGARAGGHDFDGPPGPGDPLSSGHRPPLGPESSTGAADPSGPGIPEYGPDPATLVRQADEYVDAKLGAFEAVLGKTLEAVGRGRRKLHGPAVDGALGEHMAAQDAAGVHQQGSDTSDADYLAGLAELADEEPGLSRRPRRPQPATDAPQGTGSERPTPHAPERPRHEPFAPPIPAGPAPHQPPERQPAPPAPYEPYAPPRPDGPAAGEQHPAAHRAPGPSYEQRPSVWQIPHQQDLPHQQEPGSYAPRPQQAYEGHSPDPFAGYRPQVHHDQYTAADGHAHRDQPEHPPRRQPAALDETSLFDTGMIDLDRLRPYEEGR
ncbi:cell division initiation protein [Streptomyces albipurpureus]|uniref:Cell division initiation protein n=1 Tax=Streptomyces albipurpureus TaxID=2897419 RepID=A0ABT0UX62_9ACTN|nr:cell division initiation protein [Streptomyces sp. CWNU-1]MCM2392987.1 cell division initiation protein [Streptomyces sp. CWNU-1]